MKASLVVLSFLATAGVQAAGWTDGHSIEAIRAAIAEPIPVEAVKEAQEFDDSLMAQGSVNGTRVYLVTDGRQARLKSVVNQLLSGVEEDPGKWVVRVLDSDPKVENAFVSGGKYIYVFTGLIDNAQSDDELAFMLGHELGHSMLKHLIRRDGDVTNRLASLASIIAALSKSGSQSAAASIGQSLRASYSQTDEREADTFGVAISWRVGYDPIRGADFFSRSAQVADKARDEDEAVLVEYGEIAAELQRRCSGYRQQWNAGTIDRSQSNANAINSVCAQANQHAAAYNTALVDKNISDAQDELGKMMRSHPMPQERVAAIAAITDFFNGVRPLESLSSFEQPFRVLTALTQLDSPLLKAQARGPVAETPATPLTAKSSESANAEASSRLRQLEELRASGLISEAEYTAKRRQIVDEL